MRSAGVPTEAGICVRLSESNVFQNSLVGRFLSTGPEVHLECARMIDGCSMQRTGIMD